MAAPVLQFKRGLFTNLPALRAGEPGFTTDKYDLYVGIDSTTANNQFVGSGRFWTIESATTGSGVNLVEGTNNGTNYITLASPASLAGIVTYYLPATQGGASSVLTNDGSGNLTWGAGSANSVLSGITTVTGQLNIEATTDISGLTTVTNTTDNTLGNADTGAFQIDGGLGVNKNVTVGGNLNVQGYSEFVGVVTFKGGTINLGDANTDDINVAGEFVSSLVPNDDNSYDVGGDATKQWRHANFAGIGTFDGGLDIGGEAALASATVEDLTSGRVVLAGTGGALEDSANLTFDGSTLTVTGGTTVTGTTNLNGDVTLGDAGADTITVVGVATFTTSDVYIDNQLYVGGLEVTGGASIGQDVTTRNLSVSGISTFTGQIDGNGGADISGGETTLSSATVSDLTSGRVVLAGTSGAIEDSANLTFDGTTLSAPTADLTNATIDNLTFTSGTAITSVDTDLTAVSASDDTLASAKAIKSYVDSQVTAQDLDFAGDSGTGAVDLDSQSLTIAGTSNEVETSASGQTITIGLPAAVTVTTSVTTPTVKATNLQANDGTTAITITDSTGAVATNSNLTVGGNLIVNGSTTQVNTSQTTIEDQLLELGMVDGSAPSSDLDKDIGVIFNYYTASAKKAAVYWDDSTSRIVVSQDVSESSGVLTNNTGAALEMASLYISGCSGVQEVIGCNSGEVVITNATIDAGTF